MNNDGTSFLTSYYVKYFNRILYREIRPHAPKIVLIFILIGISIGLEAFTPLPLKVLIDNVLGRQKLEVGGVLQGLLPWVTSREALGFFVVLAYFLSGMLYTVCDYALTILSKIVSGEIIKNFSRKAFDNLEEIAIGYYNKQNIGDYIYRLSYDVDAIGTLFQFGIIPLVKNALYIVSTIVVMFIIDAKLASITLLIMPMLATGLWIFNKKMGIVTKQVENSNSMLLSFIEEVLGQLKIIQAFNQENRESKVFRKREDTSVDNEVGSYDLDFMLDLLIGIIIAIGYAIVLLYGIRAVFAGEITTGLLIVFIFYVDNLTYPTVGFINAVISFREDIIKVNRMKDFFDKKHQISKEGKIKNITDNSITFQNVSVKYEDGSIVLKNASFKIPAGKITVIVGVSGSGKTTISSLILRFIDPSKGKILLGRQDIRKFNIKQLREDISYVPQEVVLFNESIAQNIAFGKPDATIQEIKKAAKDAVADNFIDRFPSKYAFKVGEKGLKLSGGQRQRLMVARALIKKQAKIAIFDEPLSSLDVKTRATLTKNIHEFAKGKTMIIVTNILDIINQADYVIFLNQGEILHAGTAASLRKVSNISKMIISSA